MPNQLKKPRQIVNIGCAAVLVFTFVVVPARAIYLAMYPVPCQLLGELERGMPKSQVLTLLGEPSSRPSEFEWRYSGPFGAGAWVNIIFNNDGALAYIQDESAEPCKMPSNHEAH